MVVIDFVKLFISQQKCITNLL